MKINIVRFKDGQYAVMRTIFWVKSFRSIYSDYWWTGRYYINKYCKTTAMEANELYNILTDKGVMVK